VVAARGFVAGRASILHRPRTASSPALSSSTCPSGARLFAAWSESPGILTAPPHFVVGFTGGRCWREFIVASTLVANLDTDQVELVMFSEAGGLHGLTKPELAGLSTAVCARQSGAPSDWRSEFVANCADG
jgi:hypothetical protein